MKEGRQQVSIGKLLGIIAVATAIMVVSIILVRNNDPRIFLLAGAALVGIASIAVTSFCEKKLKKSLRDLTDQIDRTETE